MKIPPFFDFLNVHNNVLLHFTTKSLPTIFLFPAFLSPPCLASAYYHLLPCQPPLELDSVPLFMSSSCLPQPLRHYIVIH